MSTIFARRSLVWLGYASIVSWFLLSACAAPTEIRLNVYTDVACADDPEWKGIAVYVGGADQNIENKAPALTSKSCDHNGQIGSLVIVPSGSKDDEVALRVVAGLGQNPEDCATHDYKGCIVARRSLRFSPHSTLDLDVTLTGDCQGIGCDAAHTCVAGTCSQTDVLPEVPVDTTLKASTSAAGNVRCGDNGVFCATSGNVCCLTVDSVLGTTTGECKPGQQCQSPNVVLYCDDESDCAALDDDQGGVGMCMLSYEQALNLPYTPMTVAGSQCVAHAGTQGIDHLGLEMCESRMACLEGRARCVSSSGQNAAGDSVNPLPGYFWCLIDVNLYQ